MSRISEAQKLLGDVDTDVLREMFRGDLLPAEAWLVKIELDRRNSVYRQAHRLNEEWHNAVTYMKTWPSDQANREEDEAYDALVDYVEAHGLDGSEYDPR